MHVVAMVIHKNTDSANHSNICVSRRQCHSADAFHRLTARDREVPKGQLKSPHLLHLKRLHVRSHRWLFLVLSLGWRSHILVLHCLSISPQSSFKKTHTGKQHKRSKCATGWPLTTQLCTSLLSKLYHSKSNTLNSSVEACGWYNHTPLFRKPLFSVIRLKNHHYQHYTHF